jgi:hypothetical protein
MPNECAVAKYLEVLSHELVRYDMQTSARSHEMSQAVDVHATALGFAKPGLVGLAI